MKYALSNIMWGNQPNEPYLEYAAELGFSGLELAPNVIWQEPAATELKMVNKFKDNVNSFGLRIVSMHALLFTRQDLKIFENNELRNKTSDYLFKLGKIAHELECPIMVLGSPRNRSIQAVKNDAKVKEIAVQFFKKLGDELASLGVTLCIEPLSTREADFVTNHRDALDLLDDVNSAGFGIMLDAKSLKDDILPPREVILNVGSNLRHFHVNDGGNNVPGSVGDTDHEAIGSALKEISYKGFVSLEVGRDSPDFKNNIKNSFDLLNKYY